MPKASGGRGLSARAAALVAVSLGAIAIALYWLAQQDRFVSRLPTPLNDPGSWPVALIFLAIPGSIVFVIIKKMIDVRRAASWTAVPAHVITATLVAQHVAKSDGGHVKNVPAVEYEFVTPDGHHVTGRRISLGEDAAVNADETLAKYAVGAAVTAYYNPARPAECVLERDPPANMTMVLAVVLGLIVVGIPLGYFGLRAIYRALEARVPDGHAAFVMFFTAGGLMLLLGGLASRLMARRANAWPIVAGRIVTSGVESYTSRANRTTVTYFKPAVEYAYSVHGREFRGRRLDFGADVGPPQPMAERKAAEFPAGLQVQVHYDPSNPSEAVLKTSAGSPAFVFGLAVAFFVVAYLFAR